MEALYEKLREIYKEKLEEMVEKKQAEYHFLLTKNAAVKLLAWENGLIKDRETSLKEVGKERCIVHAKVYKVKSGYNWRVIILEEEGHKEALLLKGKEAKKYRFIKAGDKVMVKGVVREDFLKLAYGGYIAVEEPSAYVKVDEAQGWCNVYGKVTGKGSDWIEIDGKKTLFFKEGKDRAAKIEVGCEVVAENVYASSSLYAEHSSRIFKRGKVVVGVLKSMEAVEGGVVVDIDGKRFTLDENRACAFLGVSLPKDIPLSTVVKLKKEMLLNKKVVLKEVG